jgi:hypothetical protein
MKTKKVPTLAEITKYNVDSLIKNELPTDKDALDFFNRVKNWHAEKPESLERRQIFKGILKTYKKRCPSKDSVRRQNEIWSTINAILRVWEKRKDAITINAIASAGRRPSFSFPPPFKGILEENSNWATH